MARVQLEVTKYSSQAIEIREKLESRIVGQKEAIDALIDVTEKYHSGLYDHSRPIGSLLFVGPTGVGKSEICDAFAFALHGDDKLAIKLDCGEFQHSQDICKLIGSPPGYLGHRETPARLTPMALRQVQTEKYPVSIILIDEIEKASDALWHILLSILDKSRLTLGDNSTTDFHETIIVMTSNAGSTDMAFAVGSRIGIHKEEDWSSKREDELKKIAVEAAKRKFTPEFINRLDKVIAFHTLTKEQIHEVLERELVRVYKQMFSQVKTPVAFVITDAAKKHLVDEGYDPKYNGRHIRRAVEKHITIPLAKAIVSGQVTTTGTGVVIDYNGSLQYYMET